MNDDDEALAIEVRKVLRKGLSVSVESGVAVDLNWEIIDEIIDPDELEADDSGTLARIDARGVAPDAPRICRPRTSWRIFSMSAFAALALGERMAPVTAGIQLSL
jgi:hypothetical protein